ncbi:MAG TPA: [protein-PII] uridylyltransferase [Sporichthyaceae bacterium]|nr:[protein-PII] uridylyltransferase [Sporichthyaceae bacterium]
MTYAQARAALLERGEPFGPQRRAALREAADAWLINLLRLACKGDESDVALVAVGGYGRGDLVAGSDLDVLLLHNKRRDVGQLADAIWYPVWDAGVKLDHSVRTVDQARAVAGEDLKAMLGLLDVRHVAGDAALTDQLRSAVLGDWRTAAPKRLPELSAMRHEQGTGELAFLLEPDLKESRGGLRDLVALRAVAASWVTDVPHERIAAAHDRLLDVRDALHTVTGRATDRLVLQEQDNVAVALGLLDATALMRSLAEVGRTIVYASDITWRRVGQQLDSRTKRFRLPGKGGKPGDRVPLADGVVASDGEAVLARDADPAKDPVLVLRAAAAAAQAGLPLSPGTVDRLAATARRLPEPWSNSARAELIRLLGAGHPAVPVWEALDLAGVITTLLPDWSRVSCRPQRNAVHKFTVDRHLVETAANAAAFTRRVSRPDLLLLGGLFHDIGKGWPGDHSIGGETVVRDLAPRLGFPPEDVEVIALLVRHHLLLPDTATRRDLDDPATAAGVAEIVGSVEVLDLLAAMTEADALATGPAAWTPWRAELITTLVERTRAVLQGKSPKPTSALSEAQRAMAAEGVLKVHIGASSESGTPVTIVSPDRVGLLHTVAGVFSVHRLVVRSAVTETIGSCAVTEWTVSPEFGSPPDASLLRSDILRVLDGRLDLAERLARREAAYVPKAGIVVPPPSVSVVAGASDVATVLEVRAHDRPGLLHRVGQALFRAEVDIRSAKVATWGAEAVDVFYLVDPVSGGPLSEEYAQKVRALVLEALD